MHRVFVTLSSRRSLVGCGCAANGGDEGILVLQERRAAATDVHVHRRRRASRSFSHGAIDRALSSPTAYLFTRRSRAASPRSTGEEPISARSSSTGAERRPHVPDRTLFTSPPAARRLSTASRTSSRCSARRSRRTTAITDGEFELIPPSDLIDARSRRKPAVTTDRPVRRSRSSGDVHRRRHMSGDDVTSQPFTYPGHDLRTNCVVDSRRARARLPTGVTISDRQPVQLAPGRRSSTAARRRRAFNVPAVCRVRVLAPRTWRTAPRLSNVVCEVDPCSLKRSRRSSTTSTVASPR